MTRLAAIPLLMLATCGCASPRAALRKLPEADITTAAQVRPHLHQSDILLWWFFFFVVGGSKFEDPNCPIRGEFGKSMFWVGGCIDKDGFTWSGSKRVRLVRGVSVHYREFPIDPPEGTGTIHGHARLNRRGLSIALRYGDEDSGQNVIIFEGHQSGVPPLLHKEKSKTVVTGTGFFANEEHGKVEFETHEVRDGSVCETEPVSGSTRLFSGAHTVEVTYDGAVNCDGLAPWTLDGVPMGELKVPQCSATDDDRRWPWLFLLLIAAAARRRQRRPRIGNVCSHASTGLPHNVDPAHDVAEVSLPRYPHVRDRAKRNAAEHRPQAPYR